MRTTLDLPENLIDVAMRATNIGTKTAVIVRALEDLVRKSKIQDLKRYRGKINLDIDIDHIRNRN